MEGLDLLTSLPNELLDIILSSLVWPTGVAAFALVHKRVHLVANRALYRKIRSLPAAKCVRLLQAIVHDKSSPRFSAITMLTLDFGNNIALPRLFFLIRDALRRLSGLKSLRLDFSSSDKRKDTAWILPMDSVFQLQSFTASFRLDGAVAEFLETQADLREVSFHGPLARSSFKLAPTALPLLDSFRTLHTSCALLTESVKVITSRPVQKVSLTLRGEETYRLLEILKQSTKPIQRLTVMLIDCGPPAEFLAHLGTLHPHLTALHVVALVQDYNSELLLACTPELAAFTSLRYVTLLSSSSGVTVEEERQVAKAWGGSCPTLRTAIFPTGSLWFKLDDRPEWMSVE